MATNINQNNGLELNTTLGSVKIFNGGNIQVFQQSDTFTTPVGVKAIKVRVWGAGGSGRTSDGPNTAGGGAGGGYAEKVITSPNSTYTVTIGAGGDARAGGGNVNGVAGGTSSFGSACSATGGGGGTTGVSTGGTGSGGDINRTGGGSGNGNTSYAATGGGSAAGPWGNGFASGNLNNVQGVTGGAGTGGSSASLVGSLGGYPTSGGGSYGPGTITMSGPGYDGTQGGINRVVDAGVTATAVTIYGKSGNIPAPQSIRFPGEFCWGAGGGAIYGIASQRMGGIAGHGGTGGGGGSFFQSSGGADVYFNNAGSGGPFGGGGAGRYASGGAGGIAAGGGGTVVVDQTNYFNSGAGGNGLIVVEW